MSPSAVTASPSSATPSPTSVTPSPSSITSSPSFVTPSPSSATPSPTEVTPSPTEMTPPPTEMTPFTTRSVDACFWASSLDVVILNDISCTDLSTTQCHNEQSQIAYVVKAIKGVDNNHNIPSSRVAYIEFNGVNVSTKVALNDNIYNANPVNSQDIDNYFYLIKDSDVCDNISSRSGDPNVLEAIQEALHEFDKAGSVNQKRDMKIVLFSNCKAQSSDVNDVCNLYEDLLIKSNYGNYDFFNAYMVNNGINFIDDEEYLMCLTEYDADRVYTNTLSDDEEYYKAGGILEDLKYNICAQPTQAPTTDPTSQPSTAPTPESLVVDVSCTTRKGTTVNAVGSTSSASCEVGETLVSCGIDGWHNIGGSTIIDNECIAQTNSADEVSAQAVCCIFPDDAVVNVSTSISSVGELVTAECASDTVLTGCGAYYSSGAYNKVQGSYTGTQSTSTPQELAWIDTDNKCTAGSYASSFVTANAQCLTISSLYTLQCVTKAKYDNYANYGTCDDGYSMFGCNAWLIAGTLDDYWRNNDDQCYVQKDGYNKLYANAVCCRLSRNPIRRLQEADQDLGSFDVTSDKFGRNAPCIMLSVKLATENLVPLNEAPDVESNIYLIGKALANITGGYVSLPEIPGPQNEGEEVNTTITVDPEWDWQIDASCVGQSQVNERTLPSKPYNSPAVQGDVSWNEDGLYISIPLETEDSVVYVFDVKELTLTISHDCSADLTIIGSILNDEGDVLAETVAISVVPNDNNRSKTLPFESTLRLSPNTSYEIVFKSNGSIPVDCYLDNIDLSDEGDRRRLSDSSITYNGIVGDANPNSCQLGKGLAKSDDMKTGCKTMCEATSTNKVEIQQGLFNEHASMNAIGQHIVEPGSIKVFNTSGDQVFIDSSWPGNGIKSPCIAIDEDTKRVFAVGGYDSSSGNAVDTISVYQFTNDALTEGKVLSEARYDGWVLDEARYGSMCYYWKESTSKEHIIVVSGMSSKTYEFTDKTKFKNDILLFEIPQNDGDLSNWSPLYGRKTKYIPTQHTVSASNTTWTKLIAARLLLYDNHILYLFGGRTHKSGQKWIFSFDLNLINEGEAKATGSAFKLSQSKAQPLIDKVDVNFGTESVPILQSCYMIFGGQSFQKGIAVEVTGAGDPGLTTSNLQLFCNDNIDTTLTITGNTVAVARRRLKEENIVSFTEFDRKMMNEGATRRRLSDDEDIDEILIREYDWSLDDIWYNLTVRFELCYADNDALQSAVESYEGIIEAKEENGDEWETYKEDTQQDILDESLKAYAGSGSNGFGAVKLFDLDILNITYLPIEEEEKKCGVSTDTELRRRLMQESIPNTPCAQVRLDVETENLLPTNDEPHPASNIVLIARALSELTDAAITMDYVYTETEDEDETNTTDSGVVGTWTIDPDCIGDAQYEDTYFPKGLPFAPTLKANVTFSDESGLSIVIPITTPESIVYVFEVTALSLVISQSCSEDITIIGGIYQSDILMDETGSIVVPPNESGIDRYKTLSFSSAVVLDAGMEYEIRFGSVGTLPIDCGIDNIDIGDEGDRRRLADDEYTYDGIAADAKPNSCALGMKLAKSDDMAAGATAMCKGTSSRKAEIEASLFEKFDSQSAIGKHLVKPGSIEVLDSNGDQVFIDESWPGNNVKSPCIAIDNATKRVFAVGGYDSSTGNAVDTILVYQFTNDNLTEGEVLSDKPQYAGWVLDKARYGSTCFYYQESTTKEHLVVVTGMSSPSYEFTDKSKFFGDIVMFEIPQSDTDLTLWNSVYKKKTKYLPTSGKVSIPYTLIASRPLLYSNHYLYSFGGRTHLGSKKYVWSFDLNDITGTNPASTGTMSLTKGKAQPLIDKVDLNMGTIAVPDIGSCYMIFAGQSFQKGIAVEVTGAGDPGLTFENLQLFCNDNIDTTLGIEANVVTLSRRRLEEEKIVSLTEFDRKMLNEGRRRRRLGDDEETEILIRNYKFGLDGIWYSFHVEFELCYDDNDALKDGIQYYKDIISSKQENGTLWNQFAEDIEERILNESLVAYKGWNDIGFGAVKVTDLDTLSINYEDVPLPPKLSHPQRRKARFWDQNIEEKSHDFIWIDEKVDDIEDNDE